MKKLLPLLLVLIMLCCLGPAALAASQDAKASADTLHELGLFQGTGTNADGTPQYDLDRAPTRNEAVTMLVRLLGAESAAKDGSWDTPFTDVPDWAKPYVGYAYANGLTNGTGAATFGGSSLVTASQYLTFVLRALGYESGSDFQWDKAWELSDKLGITNGTYDANSAFVRGDVAKVSVAALAGALKDSDDTLADKLVRDGVFTRAAYDAAKNTASRPPIDPNDPENVALYSYSYDTARGGYVIIDYRQKDYNLDSDYCVFPSEYQGQPVVGLSAYINSTKAEKVYIPTSLVYIKEPNCLQNLDRCTEYVVAAGNPAFCAVDGVLMSKDQTELIRYPEAKKVSAYTIPSTVKSVAHQAFRGADCADIIIPTSVTYVDYCAFNTFHRTTVHVLGSTAGWDLGCFWNCRNVVEESPLSSAPARIDGALARKEIAVTSVDYLTGKNLVGIRIKYEKPSDTWIQGRVNILYPSELFNERPPFLFLTDQGAGEATLFAPKEYLGKPWFLSWRIKDSGTGDKSDFSQLSIYPD